MPDSLTDRQRAELRRRVHEQANAHGSWRIWADRCRDLEDDRRTARRRREGLLGEVSGPVPGHVQQQLAEVDRELSAIENDLADAQAQRDEALRRWEVLRRPVIAAFEFLDWQHQSLESQLRAVR